jgi:hypothetical protein
MIKMSRVFEAAALCVTAMSMAVTLTITGKILVMVVAPSPVYSKGLDGDAASKIGQPPATNKSARRSGTHRRRVSSAHPQRKAVVATLGSSSPDAAGTPANAVPGDVNGNAGKIRVAPARPLPIDGPGMPY